MNGKMSQWLFGCVVCLGFVAAGGFAMEGVALWVMAGLIGMLALGGVLTWAGFGKPVTGEIPLRQREERVMKKKGKLVFASVVLMAALGVVVMGSVQTVSAEVPETISYQGYLEDSDGNPLNETVSMVLKIYDADETDVIKWTETLSNVDVIDGIFNVILGETTPIGTDVAEGERYLGVTVGGNAEMTPRQKLNSVAFAIRAGVAESVADGAIKAENIALGAITAEKMADGSVSSVKLAPSAVTGDKLAPNAITSEKISDKAVSKEKLSEYVQQKLEQGGSLPATVATLNVTEKLKVGQNSINLGTTSSGLPNSIATSSGSGDLLVQSESGNNQNTIINANNAGNVGIGTDAPKAKLKVKGVLKLSPVLPGKLDFEMDSNYSGFKGIWAFYNETESEGEISSVDLSPKYKTGDYSRLIINGKDVIINEAQVKKNGELDPFKLQPGAVSIGYGKDDLIPDPPKEGAVHESPQFGLVVKGKIGIGTSKPQYDLHLRNTNAKIAFGDNNTLERAVIGGAANVLVGEYDDGSGDSDKLQLHGKKGIYFTTGNYQGGHKRIGMRIEDSRVEIGGFALGTPAESANGWIGMTWLGDNTYWDTNSKTWKRKPGEWNHLGGVVVRGERTYFLSRGSWENGNEWSQEDFFEENTTIFMNGWQVGINTIDPKQALDVHGNIAVYGVYHTSDRRWKKDIEPLRNSLEKVSKLQGVSYKWDTENHPEMEFNGDEQIGFIAQDVEPIIPELVTTDDDGYKSVSYEKMTAVLVEAVKELKAENDALKAQSETFKTIICEEFPEKAICH